MSVQEINETALAGETALAHETALADEAAQELTTTAPASGADREGWSHFLLRRGGLPFDLVEDLRTSELDAWFQQGERLREEERRAGERASLCLEHEVIPQVSDGTKKRAINLRRTVRAGRIPDLDAPNLGELLEEFPDLADLLGQLVGAAQAARAHEARGDEVAEAEIARVRGVLAEASNDPRLRQGILLQSRDLDGFLAGYDASAPTTKRVRRLERSLLNYVYRACAKTSPFSTLGVVGVGSITPADAAVDGAAEAPADAAADAAMTLRCGGRMLAGTGLNLGVLGRIIDIVSHSDTLLGDVPLALNSSVEDWETRLRYVRRIRRAAKSDAPVDMGQLSESVFYLGSEIVTAAVVSILPRGTALTSQQVAQQLLPHVGGDLTIEHVTEYLHALLRVGFLVTPALVVDISSPRPVQDFAARLATLECPWALQTAAALLRLEELAQDYAGADVAGRRQLDGRLRAELEEIETVLDAPGRLSALDTVVFEDVADPGVEALVSGAWWTDGVMPVLQDYGKVLSLYDPSGPMRLSMAAYFQARYGKTGVEPDVTAFLHEFGQDCFEQLQQGMLGHQDFAKDLRLSPLPNWFRLPTLDRIDTAKLQIRAQLQELVDEHGSGARCIELDPDWLSELAATIPSTGIWEQDPRSYFVQVANRDTGALAVLNKSYCGMGLHVSRFARLIDRADTVSLTEYARSRNRVGDTGVVIAELRGGLDTTNLNLHPHLTDYELVCPGETSFRPEHEQIPLASLEVRGRPDGIYLWSESLQAQVIPVYLGFLMPFALPTMQQELLLFSSANMAMPNLWNGVDLGEAAHYPRLQVGQVVLRRESWFVPVEELPEIPAAATAAEQYAAWRSWQAERGLPDRVFLQPRSSRSSVGDEDGDLPAMLATKPQYVDLTSEVSLRLFAHNVRQQKGEIELVEMLPGPDELCADSRTGERYVAEFTIDINPPSESGAPRKEES